MKSLNNSSTQVFSKETVGVINNKQGQYLVKNDKRSYNLWISTRVGDLTLISTLGMESQKSIDKLKVR